MLFGLSKQNIEKIRKVILSYPQVNKIILYGSRAKGNYREGSDIDLALIGNNLSLQTIHSILNDLDNLNLPYMFDISAYDKIENIELIEHIKRVGVEFL